MKITRNNKLILAALVSASAVTLWAFNPQPDPPGFGAISILPAQAMRINVVCLHNPPSEHTSTAQACNVNVAFNSPDGRSIKQATLTVQPNATGFLELNPTDLRGIVDPNFHVGGSRAIVPTVVPAIGSRVVPTVEVFDSFSGKTELLANPAAPRLSFFAL